MSAAAEISADELWPTNSAPWPSSSTGRDLTGTNVILGIWEADGGVLTNHQEFSGRVIQMDNHPTQLSDHASGVAGTMAAGGSTISLSGLPTGELSRGVAFNAYVDAYDIEEFNAELASASAGTTNIVGLRTSNHSYGIESAWDIEYIDEYYYNGQMHPFGDIYWVWTQFPGYIEDPICGLYFPNTDGTGCNEIDAFMSTNAPRHLLVYSSGNNRNWGPGTAGGYFIPSSNGWDLVYYTKDWSSGDGDAGFDTVMPPGVAKNVLTVGSVKDVYHDEGGLTWGYASNSTINLSDFSACGPTDDGRIKPDVVAVGEADSSVRSYGIVTPISSATDSYTSAYSGTSFSAPLVTGGLGLCQERRKQLFPDLDPETDDLLNSSLKALAIHTADDVLNAGPDYLTGWGLFNAVSAVEQIELDALHGRGTHIKELELAVGETNSWMVTLDGSAFKATIAWSDLPGEFTGYVDDDTPMLVNNLDLWVENEAGTQIFQPWVLDPDLEQERESVRNTSATTGYDDINNVEQVEIAAPAPGYYRIVVTHAGGTIGEQSPSDQKVSILTTGDTPLSPVIAEFEQSPTNGTFLLSVKCDPGAHMQVETCTDLSSGSWQTNGTFTTVANTNSVFVTSSSDVHFWRVRRETGVNQ
ncbi:MAG: S8 family serine peptidase [Pontiellaceae bacterium]|nr:S8 family serine peptidase [Pontiellaceae bacterium]